MRPTRTVVQQHVCGIGQESMRRMVVAWRAIHAWRERILSGVQVS